MSKATGWIGAAVCCAGFLTGTAFGFAPPPVERPLPPPTADRPAPPATAVPATADRAAPTLRVKSILGTKVTLKGGLTIGTVEDVVFDDDGYVDYLIVRNEGKDVVVPWEAAKFDFQDRTATVDIAPDVYKTIPTYTTETLPNVYEPAYREKIYSTWNVKPRREIRREERRP